MGYVWIAKESSQTGELKAVPFRSMQSLRPLIAKESSQTGELKELKSILVQLVGQSIAKESSQTGELKDPSMWAYPSLESMYRKREFSDRRIESERSK